MERQPADHLALGPVGNSAVEVQEVTEDEDEVEVKLQAKLPVLLVEEVGAEDVGVSEEGGVDPEDEFQSLLYIKNGTVEVFLV